MDERQGHRQIKYKLLLRRWAANALNGLVFGSGKIVPGRINKLAFESFQLPAFILVSLPGRSDPDFRDEPGLFRQDIGIRIYSHNESDQFGESAIIGGVLTGGSTTSEGRGLLEIQREFYAVVKDMNDVDGIRIRVKANSQADMQAEGSTTRIVFRDYVLTMEVDLEEFFHTCSNLVATDQANGGDVLLVWDVPPDRFDLFRVILRRASGAVAPTSITDGTGVTLSGDLATTVTDSIGSTGTFSYALFATYDDDNGQPEATPSNDDLVSDALTRLSVVVT